MMVLFLQKPLKKQLHTNQMPSSNMPLKSAVLEMKPWQFGVYGMPLSVERKYVGTSSSSINSSSYITNKVALEDLFYGLVTGTSP